MGPSDSLTEERGAPRVGLQIRHPRLAADLTRLLEILGCRVVADPVGGSAGPPCEVLVVDTDRGLDGVESSTPVVWLGDGGPNPVGGQCWRIPKPFGVADLQAVLGQALGLQSGTHRASLDPILRTRNAAFSSLLDRARRWAGSELPIEIAGEWGVGCRALAAEVHAWSPRGTERCFTLDRVTLEGAGHDVQGFVEEGVGGVTQGSVVLVDPADWPVSAQQALARVLARRGPSARLLIVVREALAESAAAGRLPWSLVYRLEGKRLDVPPLRDRPEDLRPLCEALLRRAARELGSETPGLSEALLASWREEGVPGNRLGLESRIRGALLGHATSGAGVEKGALGAPRSEDAVSSLDLKRLERETIVRALAHWQGNRTKASASLGISVRTLRNKIREYGLR